MSLYCSDDDLLILLQEELPKVLSNDPVGQVGGVTGEVKRKNALIVPASAWIDSVYSLTAPFPEVGDGAQRADRIAEGEVYTISVGEEAVILNTNPNPGSNDLPDCVKDFDTRNRIFKAEESFPETGVAAGPSHSYCGNSSTC